MAAEWTPPEAEKMGEEEFAEFRKDCLEDDGWEESMKTSKLAAYRKKIAGASINLVKVKTTFKDIPPSVLYNIFHDHAYRKTWDLNMIDGHVIEMLSANNEIGYYSASASGISNRDFVNLRAWKARPEEGEWLIVNHSVKHKDYPDPKKGYVRAWSIRSGYFIQKCEDEGCGPEGGSNFIYMSCADPRGWIPKWIINSFFNSFVPGAVDKMYNAAKGYVEWKEKQEDPNFMPWLKEDD